MDRAPTRWVAAVGAVVGFLTLAGAILGSWSVSRIEIRVRLREIGIRAALGAPPGALVRWVVLRTARSVGLGVMLSIPVAIGVGGVLETVSGSLPIIDPVVFGAMSVTVLAASLFAVYPIAKRAAVVDPGQTMRGVPPSPGRAVAAAISELRQAGR